MSDMRANNYAEISTRISVRIHLDGRYCPTAPIHFVSAMRLSRKKRVLALIDAFSETVREPEQLEIWRQDPQA